MTRALLVYFLCVLHNVSGAVLEVQNWVVPAENEYFPNMDAVVGDTLIFTWPGTDIASLLLTANLCSLPSLVKFRVLVCIEIV